MKTIICIEHKRGTGFWRTTTKSGWSSLISMCPNYEYISSQHNDPSKFPTFREDINLYNQVEKLNVEISDYLFAFKSIDQMLSGLTLNDLKYCINKLGFSVYMIEVSDCIESPYQIVYKPEHIIEKKNINFMFL